MHASSSGGASAAGQGRDLRDQARVARAARAAGQKVVRGKSATAFTKQAKAWDAGATGEGRVARQLDRLGHQGFTTLHDVLLEPGKPWNLDHLVIGPGGVLFVDAKMWRGRMTLRAGALWRTWYGGPVTGTQRQDMSHEVAKVTGMAARAAARLGLPVTPVLCLAGQQSRQFTGTASVGALTVLSVDSIVGWLRDSRPTILAPAAVAATADLARRLFPPAAPTDPDSPAERQKAAWAAAMRTGGPPRLG